MPSDECSSVEQITSTKEEFAAALRRASEIVASWPQWKQTGDVRGSTQTEETLRSASER